MASDEADAATAVAACDIHKVHESQRQKIMGNQDGHKQCEIKTKFKTPKDEIQIRIQENITSNKIMETEHNEDTCTDRSVDVALANRLAEVAFVRLDFIADAGGI